MTYEMGRMGVNGVRGDPQISVMDGRAVHGTQERGTQEEKRMGEGELS